MGQPYGATPLFSEIRPISGGYLLLTAKGVAGPSTDYIGVGKAAISALFASAGMTSSFTVAPGVRVLLDSDLDAVHELHAEVFGATQRLEGGELPAAGRRALLRGRAIPDLLFGEHSGDQQHAERRPDSELRANRKIEAPHRQVTCNGDMIGANG